MKILKTLLLIIAVLLAIFLILGLIAPRKVDVSRELVINAPVEKVFGTVNELKTWEHWSPWRQKDSTLKVTYGEKTSGEGASYSWTSENSGSGKYTIAKVNPPHELISAIQFEMQGNEGEGYWEFEEQGTGSTKVQWGLRFDMPYPFNAMLLFQDMDGAIGPDFELGLDKLKAYIEEQAEMINDLTVKKEPWGKKHYLAVRKDGAKWEEIPNLMSAAYAQIGAFLGQNGITPAGPPVALYYAWNEETQTTDMAPAMPVAELPDAIPETLAGITLEADSALLIDYYGDYNGIGAAHEAMDAYLKEHQLRHSTPVMEIYMTDPGSEQDTSQWHTQVVYLLEL